MIRISHTRRLSFLPVLFILVSSSCSSSNGIDDYYTFNVAKSQSFSVSPQLPLEQNVSDPFLIIIDSADFKTSATFQTNLLLVKSVKLTKFIFTPSDVSFPMTNFDTIQLIVSADSLPDLTLATYSGALDSITLTNADFAVYMKKPSLHYTVIFRANKAPGQTVSISTAYTLVFTAAPIQ